MQTTARDFGQSPNTLGSFEKDQLGQIPIFVRAAFGRLFHWERLYSLFGRKVQKRKRAHDPFQRV
jgi:hypothetical protein